VKCNAVKNELTCSGDADDPLRRWWKAWSVSSASNLSGVKINFLRRGMNDSVVSIGGYFMLGMSDTSGTSRERL